MNSHDSLVIHTHGLTKSHAGVPVLKGRISVPKHSICGFLGPNGAGKSPRLAARDRWG